MSAEVIRADLQARFAAPLPDFYRRRIIFWHDEEQEFEGLPEELALPGVKLLRLTGSNNFAAKSLLLHDDPDSDYLVYVPFAYAAAQDNWLTDIELYSESFRADAASMLMENLHIPAGPAFRKAVKQYRRFFENKERTAKFRALHSDYGLQGHTQIHTDILAVLAGAHRNTASDVIRAVLASGLDVEQNTALVNIKKYGDETAFWALVGRYTGYAYDGGPSLLPLAGHILLTTLSLSLPPFAGLEKLVSLPHQQLCYALVNEWLHSDQDDVLYDIAREVETQYQLPERFGKLETGKLFDCECFPCINECILRVYMGEIADNVIKTEDIIRIVERRRTLKWYKRVRYYFDGLLQVAQMQQFYQANAAGFHTGEHEKLWVAYCRDYYKMDVFYRKFHTAFGSSLKETSTVLDDLYKSVADYVERLYKNWFLPSLSAQWTSLTRDELARNARLPGIPYQEDFYRSYVEPALTTGGRVYVIISDALRYEVGAELTDQLLRDTRGTAEMSAMQAVFPSVTKYGMAALLPHKRLGLNDKMQVLCDGAPTEGAAGREKILEKCHPGNVAITYKALLGMKQDQRHEVVSQAQVVYIYHDAIDAVGENRVTEDQVLAACDQAILEIKNLIRMIINDMNGTNIIITADHGFLYSYQPLEESDKVEKSALSGDFLELDRRYALLSGECSAEHMLKIPLKHFDSALNGFTPLDNIRMKAPGGMNYVHGGVSLQELVIPVIEFRNVRASSRKYVEVTKADLRLLSQSRKISNSIFSLDFYQKESVGGKITEGTYEIYMANAAGAPVSDKQTVIADKTGSDGADRVFRVRFTLKGLEFRKTEPYYLVIQEKGTVNVVEKTEFMIDIAFTNEFDF